MPDMSAIAIAISSLNAAKNIAESMIGLRDAATFQGKLIEFQSKLIDANNASFAAQDERFSLLQRIRELEEKVTDFEAWEHEKQRYELKNLGDGAFAQMLKPGMRGTEPPHWICTNCYEHGHKATLQNVMVKGRGQVWTCPSCKSTIDPMQTLPSWLD
jgi:rubrerythrin